MKNNNTRFNETNFASRYYQKHQTMASNLGDLYTKKLLKAAFSKGKILDAGCGFGGTLFVLAKNFSECEFIGVDLSEPLLEIAKHTTDELGFTNRMKFLKEDVQKMPFDDGLFDVVLNLNMVHLVENPVLMFNEIRRVLKAEGRFFIKDLRRSWLSIFEREIKSTYSKKEALDIINKSDLQSGKFSSRLLWWNYEKF